MMGQHARQNELWSEPVNLARRIPADHALRKLRETVKLDFVREEVAGCYGRKGNVSVDPEDDFAMKWELEAKGAKHVSAIARSVKGSEGLILATDPDREG